jgi:hypothetical protein
VDKSLVNSVLSREGKDQFSYDRATFSYRLVGSSEGAAVATDTPTAPAADSHQRDAILAAAERLLAEGKARTAKEIAAELRARGMADLDKQLVNSVLAREGKGRFEYNREGYTYRQAQTSGDRH